MKSFDIEITETLQRTVSVAADSREEAEQMVDDGWPNSDSDFGAGYTEGKVLMSKRVNADYYSKMMAEKAGSTVSLDANYDAIQNHVNGMSIADAEALSKDEKAVDAVSGATLVDTAGYVGVLVDAAK